MAEYNAILSHTKNELKGDTIPMETDARTNTEHLLSELQRIVDLAEPARLEVTKLSNEVRTRQENKIQKDDRQTAALESELQNAKKENLNLTEKLANCQKLYKTKSTDLEIANETINKLNGSIKIAREQECILQAKHKEEVQAYKEVNFDLEKRIALLSNEIENLKKSRENLVEKAKALIADKKEENIKLRQSVQQLDIQKVRLEKELSETKFRLSKLMGDKLARDNPDIADLSDEYRPTKIAEKYQELYDNQWTDAFENAENFFSKETERTRITVLYGILQNIYQFCKDELEKQDRGFLEVLFGTHDTEKLHSALPEKVQTNIKELKSYAISKFAENLPEKYLMKCDKTNQIGKFTVDSKDFVHECVILCWHMVNQTPPIVLHSAIKSGDKFDGSMYKHYTLCGVFVDFVVWPALLLYENGSVLSKGVVQCFKLPESSQSVRVRSKKVTATEMGIPTGSLCLSHTTTQCDVTDLQQTMTQFESNQTVGKTMHHSQTGKPVKKHSEINVKLSLATENTETPGQLEQSNPIYSIKDDHKQVNNSPDDTHQYSLKVKQPKQNNARNYKSKQEAGDFNDMHISSKNIQRNETASDNVKQFQGHGESSKQNPSVLDNVQRYPLHAGIVNLVQPNNLHSSSYYPNNGTFQQDHSNSKISQQQQQQQLQKQHQQKKQQQQLPQKQMRQQQEQEQQQQHQQQQVHQQPQQQQMEHHHQQQQVHQQQQQQHQDQQQHQFQNMDRSYTGAGQDSSIQSSPKTLYQNWMADYPTQQEYDFFISHLNAGVNLAYVHSQMEAHAFQKCLNYYNSWLGSVRNSKFS